VPDLDGHQDPEAPKVLLRVDPEDEVLLALVGEHGEIRVSVVDDARLASRRTGVVGGD
jgi:hypothetical protein